MKKGNLDNLTDLLRGLIDGTLKLQIVTADGKEVQNTRRGRPRRAAKAESTTEVEKPQRGRGRPKGKVSAKKKPGRPKKVKAKTDKAPRPRGRKPLSEAAKTKRAEKAAKMKARQAKKALPTPREIFEFLQGKIDGLKLSDFIKKFGAKRAALKGLLSKLTAKGDLDAAKGRYYLHRRLRNRSEKKEPAEKRGPISQDAILNHLEQNGPATLEEMAKGMGEASFHRLIRVVNGLKKVGKVVVGDGKKYSLAEIEAKVSEPGIEADVSEPGKEPWVEDGAFSEQ